jgi:hypothetical protein
MDFTLEGGPHTLHRFIEIVCCCQRKLVIGLLVLVGNDIIDQSVFSFFWFNNKFRHYLTTIPYDLPEDVEFYNFYCFDGFVVLLPQFILCPPLIHDDMTKTI